MKTAETRERSWRLSWREGANPTRVETWADVDRVLRLLLEERDGELPLLVILEAPDGKWMTIGLDEPSVATFQYGVDPPYLLSEGEVSLEGKPLLFSSEGHWTEFDPTAAIPLELACRALREFFTSGERPTSVRWKET